MRRTCDMRHAPCACPIPTRVLRSRSQNSIVGGCGSAVRRAARAHAALPSRGLEFFAGFRAGGVELIAFLAPLT
jgi:hypothetical protein